MRFLTAPPPIMPILIKTAHLATSNALQINNLLIAKPSRHRSDPRAQVGYLKIVLALIQRIGSDAPFSHLAKRLLMLRTYRVTPVALHSNLTDRERRKIVSKSDPPPWL